MAKKALKRWLPDPHVVKTHKSLQFLGHLLHDPNLFHLNRHSVAGAMFVGLFVAFLPIPGQMPVAALLALLCRVNLPISVALVWITNPLTMAPVFYTTYELGRWILDAPAIHVSLDISWSWFKTELPKLWQPLLLGSVLTGLACGTSGYVCMQMFWRWHVRRNWRKRQESRQDR
jgi:uncharacterized protein (DUF2062 family)